MPPPHFASGYTLIDPHKGEGDRSSSGDPSKCLTTAERSSHVFVAFVPVYGLLAVHGSDGFTWKFLALFLHPLTSEYSSSP